MTVAVKCLNALLQEHSKFGLSASGSKILNFLIFKVCFALIFRSVGGQQTNVALEVLAELSGVGSMLVFRSLAKSNLDDFVFSQEELAVTSHAMC